VVYKPGPMPAVCGQVVTDQRTWPVHYFAMHAGSPFAVISRHQTDDTYNDLFRQIGCPAVPVAAPG
jgi:hypothetical protein